MQQLRLIHPGWHTDTHPHRQDFDQLIWKSRPAELKMTGHSSATGMYRRWCNTMGRTKIWLLTMVNPLTNWHRNLYKSLCHGYLFLCKILSQSYQGILLPKFATFHILHLFGRFVFRGSCTHYNRGTAWIFMQNIWCNWRVSKKVIKLSAYKVTVLWCNKDIKMTMIIILLLLPSFCYLNAPTKRMWM